MPTSGTIGEVKDIVREHFSRTQFPTGQLDQALAEGRRIIEHHGNFWWMRDRKDFSLAVDQGSYSILTSTTNGLNLPNFKDAIAFSFTNTVAGVAYELIPLGTMNREEAEVEYDSGQDGSPELVIIDNDTLYIFPEDPQLAYPCRLYYWTYTENPQLNTATDVITKRFPMALAYAAIAWGYEMVLKEFNGAGYFRSLLGGQPFGHGGELAIIKKENFKRGLQDEFTLVPRLGPAVGGFRRRLDNVQIYR
mgnify:CR=1 FL=1